MQHIPSLEAKQGDADKLTFEPAPRSKFSDTASQSTSPTLSWTTDDNLEKVPELFSKPLSTGPTRIAVIGKEAFGAAVYKELKMRGYLVVGVFTHPDVVMEGLPGVRQDPLAAAAGADGVPVFKIKRWTALKRDGGEMLQQVFEKYKDVGADLNVLAFCTQFIPMQVINAPPLGSIVYHPSILPRHRGASAINHTLMMGDEKAGFTIFWADDGLDTGPILLTQETYIDPEDTVSSLYDRFLYPQGVKAMGDAVDMIQKGIAPAISQEGMPGATYEPMWTKKDLAKVDWTLDGRTIHNFIRGNDRVPGAWTTMIIDGVQEMVSLFGSQFLGTGEEPLNVGRRLIPVDGAEDAILWYDGLYFCAGDGTRVRVTSVGRSSEGGVVKAASALLEPPTVAPTFEASELSSEEMSVVEKAAAVWRGILNLETGTTLEGLDFFGAGAGSAAVAALCSRIEREAGVKVSPDAVYGHSRWSLFVGLLITTVRGGSGSGAASFPDNGLVDLGVLPNGVKASVPRLPFIDGAFVEPLQPASRTCTSPIDGREICSVAEASVLDVQRAVTAAHQAFAPDSPWRQMSARERGELLFKLADLMEEHKEELASIEALDSGAVYTLAIKTHVGMSIASFRYYAGWCDKIQGKVVPISNSRPNKDLCIAKREPIGVCALIVPWNYPLMMLAWKMAACLAAGNTCILKPARETPLTALKFAELAMKAGIPSGVINILPGSGAVIGEALATHPLVRKVGFTGSTPVGKQIMQYAAISNLKKVSLELGGKSPLLIFEDCDMEKAVKNAVQACLFNKGENCIAAGRLFVQDSIYEAFLAELVAEVKKVKIGDPFDGNTTHGPQNHKAHFMSLLAYIEKGKQEGAALIHGGAQVGDKGYFLEPAIFTGVEDHMFVAKEESFGPVILISIFNGDIEKVVRRANATEFGLACGVFTKDMSRALRVSDLLDGGTCFVNVWNKTDVAAPFGGFKQSGFGKDLGEEALNEYLKTKTVTIEY